MQIYISPHGRNFRRGEQYITSLEILKSSNKQGIDFRSNNNNNNRLTAFVPGQPG